MIKTCTVCGKQYETDNPDARWCWQGKDVTIARFPFERRRRGWFIWNRWFFVRFYPPTLPRISFWWKRR